MLFANITDSELLVLKVIMDCKEPSSLVQIQAILEEKYKKAWKRSTICTFILHLTEKGYVESHRQGRTFYYRSKLDKNAFARQRTEALIDFYFDGDKQKMLDCLEGRNVFEG